MLFSMKQCVAFGAGQGMPGPCPEHLGVAQERHGWPGHLEAQGSGVGCSGNLGSERLQGSHSLFLVWRGFDDTHLNGGQKSLRAILEDCVTDSHHASSEDSLSFLLKKSRGIYDRASGHHMAIAS